jgi:hypothetical protein
VSQEPIVRVVVGEAGEPHPGPVRWTLDIEGFDVVGQGSSRGELERVLAGVRPTVIVVDDAIPASALMALRAKAPDAGVVVVWPASVSSKAIADAHVDPGCIEEDLARAVRRAARRSIAAVADPPVVVSEPVLILPEATLAPAASTIRSPVASAAPRRSARVLLGTAAVLALIVMMVGVSFALDVTRRPRSGSGTSSTTQAPSSSRSTSSPSSAGAGPVDVGAAGQNRPECGPPTDLGSASSHAIQVHPRTKGDRGTRSRGADCGGAKAGGSQHGGASNAGASQGHADGSTGHGTGTGQPTDPANHGHSGTQGGGHGRTPPGQADTDDEQSPGHSDGSSRTDGPGSPGRQHAADR